MGLDEELTELIIANADKITRISGWIQKATKGGLLPEPMMAKMPSGQSIRVNLLRGKLARAQKLQKVLHEARRFVREQQPSFVEQVAGFEGLPEG